MGQFFHGVFLLVFVLIATPVIEMIPNAALAAMLISVGIKLAHPKEFIHTFQIGKEQLAIFLITIVFTLVEDLLVGIAAGVVLKMILHLAQGTPISSFSRLLLWCLSTTTSIWWKLIRLQFSPIIWVSNEN